MKPWKRAFLVSCVFEFPFLVLLWAGKGHPWQLPLLWYHFVPLSTFAFVWLEIFGHGGPASATHPILSLACNIAFLSWTFLTQTLLLTPLVLLLLRTFGRTRRTP